MDNKNDNRFPLRLDDVTRWKIESWYKLWEGRYSPIWPDGKKRPRNVYAHSEEECEKLLAEMIVEMKTEIAAERERLKAG